MELTLQTCLQWAETQISNRQEARVLMMAVVGCSLETLIAHPEKPVSEAHFQKLKEMVGRRLKKEPLSRIVGQREFWSLPFFLSSETLDPRPDSETLIEAILTQGLDRGDSLRMLDLGTGTGCLLLSLLTEFPKAWGMGVDQSFQALQTARKNAQNLNLADRALFIQSDWASALKGGFDVIVSNPPYIPSSQVPLLDSIVRDFDPKAALDGGEDGLNPYRLLAQQLPTLLTSQGMLALEIGQGQEKDVEKLFRQAGFQGPTWYKDLGGILRCGVFRKT